MVRVRSKRGAKGGFSLSVAEGVAGASRGRQLGATVLGCEKQTDCGAGRGWRKARIAHRIRMFLQGLFSCTGSAAQSPHSGPPPPRHAPTSFSFNRSKFPLVESSRIGGSRGTHGDEVIRERGQPAARLRPTAHRHDARVRRV